ncbi:Uncharacterised protein [Vibrio cholerae]|nr:Uncharacterised protein [Vibrio cholerae]
MTVTGDLAEYHLRLVFKIQNDLWYVQLERHFTQCR